MTASTVLVLMFVALLLGLCEVVDILLVRMGRAAPRELPSRTGRRR